MSESQFGNPRGFMGRMIIKGMNSGHGKLMDWSLGFVKDLKPTNVLDVGCGGGMMINKMSKMYTEAKFQGVDISIESVNSTMKFNADLKAASRLDVCAASVDGMPFADGTFDMVTATETYFFWPDLCAGLKEIDRVLKVGGTVMIVSESYPHPDFQKRNDKYSKKFGFTLVANEKMVSMLNALGYEVALHTVPEKNHVAFVGKKVKKG